MPGFTQSSMIGVDYNNPSSTALFALGGKSLGSNDSEWVYCIATGTITTGMFCGVLSLGTAYMVTTALIAGGDTAGTTGALDLAVAQFTVPQGQYAWFARQGLGLYVLCSATCPNGVNMGFSPNSGAITTSLGVAVGNTAVGIYITTSASTATLSVTTATLRFPRPIAAVPGA